MVMAFSLARVRRCLSTRQRTRANSQKRLFVGEGSIDEEALDGGIATAIDRDPGGKLFVSSQRLQPPSLTLRYEVLLDAVAHEIDGVGIAGVAGKGAKAA